jgi:transcriptional regulator with XRE-family HTH domain
MGSKRRAQPKRMGKKLLRIRDDLDLTQEQMAKRLDLKESPVYPTHVSEFEHGKREPSLLVLLRYARLAGVSTDVLIDDSLELPDHIPPVPEAEGIMKREQRARR